MGFSCRYDPVSCQEDNMSFIENLRKKLRIERLAKTIAVSTGAPGIPKKIEKEKMRELLSMSPYVLEKRRDLELYFREGKADRGEVLVLDNELPLYGNTTLDDVTLRRSPELKEMLSIRNIIKILNDNDILISKGREALSYVCDRTLELLDLRYERQDIQKMADAGLDAFARADTDGVVDMLELFVEVLGYVAGPADVLVNDCIIYGETKVGPGGDTILGPTVMYNESTNELRLVNQRLSLGDPVARGLIPAVATGEIAPDKDGLDVFPSLAEMVPARKSPTVH